MRQQLLLLEDVDSLGKKGEIVTAKPGYVRNYLLPKGFAVIATSNMLKKQARLQQERAEQAVIDRKESEELKSQIESISLQTKVKVDPEGHMYGSVSATDISELFKQNGLPVEKRSILVTKPIKATGNHKIEIRLKEDVFASCMLSILPEGVEQLGAESVIAPIEEEETLVSEASKEEKESTESE